MASSKEKHEDSFFSSEWTESRNVVDKLDAQLSGLRQFGFSLITVLLAGTSILYQASSANGGIVTPTVKLAVIIATFMLIDSLYATDCYYRIIQIAAAHKAHMLELKLEDKQGLSQVISTAYRVTEDWYFIDVLYYVFLLAAASLGLAVTPLFNWQWFAVILALAGFLAAIILMDRRPTKVSHQLKEKYPLEKLKGSIDS